jgi:hypothetical protein
MEKIIKNMNKKILWSGIEDYTSMWEILWEFNSNYSELTEFQKRQSIIEIVKEMVNQNWISLYWCKEPYGDLVMIENTKKEGVLSNPQIFDEPIRGKYSIRFRTTLLGEEALKNKWFESEG